MAPGRTRRVPDEVLRARCGNIRIGYLGNKDPEKEQLQLVTFEQLDESDLAQLREDVQQLEKRAYWFESSKDVYARTKPAEQLR